MKQNNIELKEILNDFLVEYDDNGCLLSLMNKSDAYKMNWVDGSKSWGTVISPEFIAVTRKNCITKNNTLEEKYIFKNISDYPIYFKTTDIGIYATFNDNYQEASECLKRRCHAHIWCGNQVTYVMALRMGGGEQNLGLVLRNGSIGCYSVERDEVKMSNDRGDFILHPDIDHLDPGKSYEIKWELFWFKDKDDFYTKLLEYDKLPIFKSKQFTYFIGENIECEINGKGVMSKDQIHLFLNSKKLSFELYQFASYYKILISIPVKRMKEYLIEGIINGVKTRASFWGTISLDQLMKKRCNFISSFQQESRNILDGAYLIYDDETKRRYYSHLDDHNGGRERLGMGALMALHLQSNHNSRLEKSLEKYVKYVYRELFDCEKKEVFNDIGRNNDWNRLYNYAWMAIFQMELFKWSSRKDYIIDAYWSMKKYYKNDGYFFYAIGIPIVELVTELENAKLSEYAFDIKNEFTRHADFILEKGINYPQHEVNFEQSIVAPAASILLQVFVLTGDIKYRAEAERHLSILELFNGLQPDFHLYENAIRHWDGYWFGKRHNYGDTFPHYWSVLTGVEYNRFFEMSGKSEYREKSSASIRGCLNLFREDGMASCAMVFPETVNGRNAHYYDPWANDQDWALYYAWKLREII